MKTASFETDTKKAEKRLKEFEKQAKAAATAIGVGVAAGVGALAYAVKETIDSMDKTGEAAERIGITTEALSGLSYAAEMSGSSAEGLQSSMLKLAKSAADGNEAFDAMGINVKDANGNLKSTDKLMLEVSDKFAGYSNGAEKSALAMELFGKSGAEMIPLLNRGAEGIAELTGEAKELGIVFSDEAAARAGDFNDQLDKLQAVGKGVTMGLASEMLPALIGVTDALVDTAKSSGFVEKAAAALVSGFRLLVSGVIIVGGAFKTVGDFLGGVFALIVEGVTGVVTGTTEAMTSIGQALKMAATGDFAGAGKALAGTFDGYSDALDRVMAVNDAVGADMVANITGTMDSVAAVWKDGEVKAKALAESSGGGLAAPMVSARKLSKDAADKLAKEAEASRKKLMDEGQKMAESVLTQYEKMQKRMRDASRLESAGAIDPETAKRVYAQAYDEYAKFQQSQNDLLTNGLQTQEESIWQSYERRRQEILKASVDSETERAEALKKLDEQLEADKNALTLSRYGDLLTEREKLDASFQERVNQLADDQFLSEEDRLKYSLAAYEAYTKAKGALDDEQLAKKKAAEEAQIAAMTKGFEGAAELAKVFGGEQSKEYAAMFAASKAYALAMNGIEQSKAIAKAWGENNYFVAGGLTVALIAQFASLASSVGGASFGGTRADGGPVNDGRSYLVGERGPEMFTPASAGSIIPNNMLQPAAQGSNIRIVNAYDSEHVADFMGSADGERVIMNAVKKNQAAVRAMARA